MAQPAAEVDPKALMDEAVNVVKQQAFQMKRALDQNNVREGLKFCVNMLCELRTGQLSPKQYYELYMLVTDQMRYLESHFHDLWRSGRPMIELYEMVQHCGNIVPRIYLLITVGSVYIKSKEAPAKEILKDLVEMCRGVQHPIRGLFLRNYLLTMSKSMLPDIGSDYGSNYEDSVDFLIQNFGEMNKLWVRMQHQGAVRDREKREAERLDLRILVGMNLVRLSQLEGVTDQMYLGAVLPKILEQVSTCKDKIAQQYLLESIIQVFPDEFHMKTLEIMLECISNLQSGVDLRAILTSFMDRLSTFVRDHPEAVPADLQIFDLFHGYIAKISKDPSINLATMLSLQVALLNFSLSLAAERVDQADNIMGVCTEVIRDGVTRNEQTTLSDSSAIKAVVDLLQIPLTAWSNTLSILELAHYPSLLGFLPLSHRKKVSISIVDSITKAQCAISTPEQVDRLFTFIASLVVKEEGEDANPPDAEEIAEEQNKVAAVVHLIQSDNTDVLMKMYQISRRHFGMGGPLRIKVTLPPLIFRFLMLAQRVHAIEQSGQTGHQVSLDKLLRKFIMDTTNALASVDQLLALRMHLMCALTADKCGKDDVAYDMVSLAFVLYEDEISDSKQQVELVTVFTGTLRSLSHCSSELYDTLVSKCTQYGAKLLKKTDQIPAVFRCSHLFWNAPCSFQDGKRTMDCLRKSGKVAENVFQSQSTSGIANVGFYLQILERYLYYYNQAMPGMEARIINDLLERIQGFMASIEPTSEEGAANIAHHKGIMAFIQQNQASQDADTVELYRQLTI